LKRKKYSDHAWEIIRVEMVTAFSSAAKLQERLRSKDGTLVSSWNESPWRTGHITLAHVPLIIPKGSLFHFSQNLLSQQWQPWCSLLLFIWILFILQC
jgi:hypothetical protein